MRRLSKRKGMTLVELLGVMFVLAILALIGFGALNNGQERARTTKAQTALDAYYSAFSSAMAMNPGMVSDRSKVWGDDGTTYTTKEAFSRVVQRMNTYLDDDLTLSWNDAQLCYVSRGLDPWGEHYVLLEYPEDADGVETYYDCGKTGPGFGRLCFSVWATGNNEAITVDKVVGKDSYGVGLMHYQGITEAKWQNISKQSAFLGYTVRFQN